MTFPGYLPGSYQRPIVSTEQRVAELENRLSEFMRRDLSNAGIGLGGRLRVIYGSGAEAVLIGTDPADDKPKVVIHDPAGNVLFRTDSDAGYGMAFPETPCPMTDAFDGYVGNTTKTLVYSGYTSILNPCFNMLIQMEVYGGSSSSVNGLAQWDLSIPAIGWTWQSLEYSWSGPANPPPAGEGSPVQIAKQLPSNAVGQQMYVRLSARLQTLPAGAPSVAARPLIAAGCSLAKAQSIGLVV